MDAFSAFVPFLLLFGFSLLGVALGTVTGLVPGFHPNNVAFILLSVSPVILERLRFLTALVPSETLLVLVAATVVAASVAHTFLNFIPAAFVGAPEGETALALLPAHRMLLEGRAYEATVLSATGSFWSVVFSFLLLVPFYFLFSSLNFYETVQSRMLYILVGISALFILTESFSERWEAHWAVLLASAVFLLSGLFGCVVLRMPVPVSPFPLFSSLRSTLLFPALTGLFGLSAVLFSLLYTPEIPEQETEEPAVERDSRTDRTDRTDRTNRTNRTEERAELVKSAVSGSAFGTLVSFLPGITSAHATVFAMLARRNRQPEQVITTLSGVNTANAIFCLATLFLISRPRSGATIAISQLLPLPLQHWETAVPPLALLYLLTAVLVASLCSFFITKSAGKQFARAFVKIPYRKMLVGIAVFLFLLVFFFTGVLGLLVLLVGTCIGLVPIYLGVRRSNCMGVILLNVILFYIYFYM